MSELHSLLSELTEKIVQSRSALEQTRIELARSISLQLPRISTQLISLPEKDQGVVLRFLKIACEELGPPPHQALHLAAHVTMPNNAGWLLSSLPTIQQPEH